MGAGHLANGGYYLGQQLLFFEDDGYMARMLTVEEGVTKG